MVAKLINPRCCRRRRRAGRPELPPEQFFFLTDFDSSFPPVCLKVIPVLNY